MTNKHDQRNFCSVRWHDPTNNCECQSQTAWCTTNCEPSQRPPTCYNI